MIGLFTIGAMVVASLGFAGVEPTRDLAGQPTSTTGLLQPTVRAPGTRVVAIGNQRVVVEVAARRSFSPLSDPRGRLVTSVVLTTSDGRPLPSISLVKISLVHGTSRWSPILSVLPSDTQALRQYVAQNGPLWGVNTTVMANVEIRSGRSTYRVAVPVTISASKTTLPGGGVITE